MYSASAIVLASIISVLLPSAYAQVPSCDTSLWTHVYHPNRLRVIDPCVTVTGVIEGIRPEADGDFHILVRLDPQYEDMINQGNIDHQHGDLVVEPICEHDVTQLDALAACSNFSSNIEIPPVGTNVTVTGSYVLDTQHYDWAEIHPATSITTVVTPEFPFPAIGLVGALAAALVIFKAKRLTWLSQP